MPFDPLKQVPVGGSGLAVTRLGFGSASIAGLYSAVAEADAFAMIEHAWATGVRYFDTAPQYGYGQAERRLGTILRQHPRDSYVLSTKVGRLLRPATTEQLAEPSNFHGVPDDRPVWDFSRDGVRRSLDESLQRLGVDRIDIVYIHDPDDHWQAAIDSAYPALHDLRDQGVIGAIGAGMNQAEMLARFAREADMDVFLCAGRYTLLDQSALAELLPACEVRGISLVIGGLLNSGILANPTPGARFDYEEAPAELLARAQGIRAALSAPRCAAARGRDAVPAGPSPGGRDPGRRPASPPISMTTPRACDWRIPDALWDDLRADGLIAAAAPVPSAAS